MIAELAAINASYDVIKQTIQNGKEIYEAGEALAQYFGLKNEIQKKAHEHGYKSDLEAFMALEELKAREEELKQMMIWQGRGGMWNDWLDYQAKMKQSRDQAEKERQRARQKRKKALVDTCILASVGVCILVSVGLVIFIFMQIAK